MIKKFIKDKGLIKTGRVAMVGLSSPVAYLYDFQRYFPDNPWDWNPILESPQGLSVLYDEIYFLHRALCPTSMINLPFVKFIEDMDKVTVNRILPLLSLENYEGPLLNFVDTKTPLDFSSYTSHINLIFGKIPSFDNPIDNHTRMFSLENVNINANSQNPHLILKDLLILEELQKSFPYLEFELITNKFTTTRLKYKPNELNERNLAQDLLINGSSNMPYIPVLQNQLGPDLNYIEKLRNANSLGDFRNKLLKEVNNEETKTVDVKKIAYDIRQEFNKYEEETLYLSPNKLKKTLTISSPILKGLSFLEPGLGGKIVRSVVSGSDMIIQGKDKYKEIKYSWASFVTAINREKRLMDEELKSEK
ncbi:hypothetical protein L1279_002492 [Planomicrobium sp. HSC-17F08]|nr:hypothetical protein [Planomicrobium sp. HSC-17F08]